MSVAVDQHSILENHFIWYMLRSVKTVGQFNQIKLEQETLCIVTITVIVVIYFAT